MSVGARHATGALIGFSDSDTRLEPQQLHAMVDELLAEPSAGDVFAPTVATTSPRTLGEAGAALLVNRWYGTVAAATAGPAQTLPLLTGPLMIFRREALDAIGGSAARTASSSPRWRSAVASSHAAIATS